MYDKNNIFFKILSKQISCDLVYEDEKVLFFNDINPRAKIHILGIPKLDVVDFSDFVLKADKEMVAHFFQKTREIIKIAKIDKSGFKIITNSGEDGGQEVPHFHIHILGGGRLNLGL